MRFIRGVSSSGDPSCGARAQHPLCNGEARARARGERAPTSLDLPPAAAGAREGRDQTLKHEYSFSRRSASCVQRFDDSRIQQFALHIAFRCGLHRCENQDIHCLKLFLCLDRLDLSFELKSGLFIWGIEPSLARAQANARPTERGSKLQGIKSARVLGWPHTQGVGLLLWK